MGWVGVWGARSTRSLSEAGRISVYSVGVPVCWIRDSIHCPVHRPLDLEFEVILFDNIDMVKS